MTVQPTNRGTFIIERGRENQTYLTMFADGKPCWSKRPYFAVGFKTEAEAQEMIAYIRSKRKSSTT